MQVYVAVVLSVVAAALAGLPYWPGLKNRLEQFDFLPPLVLACLVFVATLAPQPVSHFYKGAVLLGLLVTTLASLFYKLPGMPIYVAVAHFYVANTLYLTAFASTHRLSLPTLWTLLAIVWAATLYWYVRTHLREERYALIGLIALAGLMLWQALEMWVHNGQVWAALGLAGALLLGAAGTLLLVDRTRKPLKGGTLIVAVAFYISQGLIAWSIWGLGMPHA